MSARLLTVLCFVLLCTIGCRGKDSEETAPELEAWPVTAWGTRYEIFAETDPLIAGQPATSNAHVTVLAGFAPLARGVVAIVLRGGGQEQSFRQTMPKREGIFPVEVTPSRPDSTIWSSSSRALRVRRRSRQAAFASAPPTPRAVSEGNVVTPGEMSFLKEQQWRTEFATAWVKEGARFATASRRPRG